MLNQAFFKICTNLRKKRDEVPFEHWARRIVINTCIDEHRKNKVRPDQPDNADHNEQFWHENSRAYNYGEQDLNAESLREMIRCLPPISQQVFNLAVLDGFPYDEVARMLDVSEATCRWHVHFSRKKLQELIKKTFAITKTLVL